MVSFRRSAGKAILACGLIAALLLLATYLRGNWSVAKSPPPVADDGVLDLSRWDFQRDGIVPLDGTWEFYWQELLTPSTFVRSDAPEVRDFIKVPSPWDWHRAPDGRRLSGTGFGTYRLIIKTAQAHQQLALHLLDFGTSYAVWINGQPAAYNGLVGRDASRAEPWYNPAIARFTTDSMTTEIIVQVANFAGAHGGFWTQAQLGLDSQITTYRFRQIAFDLILAGYLALMALYQFGLFLNRRGERAPLYLSLLCLLIAARTAVVGEMVLVQAFPTLSWRTVLALQYLPVYLGVGLLILFIRRVFPAEVPRWFVRSWWPSVAAVSLSFFVLPTRLFTLWSPWCEAVVVLGGLILVNWVVINASRAGRRGAGILLFGTTVVTLTGISDFFVANDLLYAPFLVDVGLAVLTVCQSIVLSIQLKEAVESIRDLREALAEDRYRAIFENTGTAMVMINADLTVALANSEFSRLFGYPSDEVLGKPFDGFATEGTGEMMRVNHLLRRRKGAEVPSGYRGQLVDKQGRIRDIHITVSMIPGSLRSVASVIDITEQTQSEERLRRERERWHLALSNLPCGVILCNSAEDVIFQNPMAVELLGYAMEDIPNLKAAFDKFYPDPIYRQAARSQWDALIEAREQVRESVFDVVCKNQQSRKIAFGMTFLGDGSVAITVSDITERVRDAAVMRHLAFHDYLTGLPNVKLFEERLAQDLARVRRDNAMLAVAFLDLDKFKVVNDELGHQAGDMLLCEVGRRLTGALRESDTVARIGGDEFCILLPDLTSVDDVAQVMDRIMEAFSSPASVGDHQLFIAPSIGISLHPFDGETAEELMKKADDAMYRVKRQGATGYEFWSVQDGREAG